MKRFALGGTLVALLALSLAFAACGGDDDGGSAGTTSNIRTDQGLAVANLVAELNGGNLNAGVGSDNLAAPAALENDAIITDRSAGTQTIGGDTISGYSPAFQTAGGIGISAIGYGSATADADSAIIEFYFYNYGEVIPVPEPGVDPVPPTDEGGSSSGGSDGSIGTPTPPIAPYKTVTQGEVEQITEADLQPVIDALNAAGAQDVEFIGQTYYDVYSSSATIRATVNNIDSVEAVVQAGTDASANLGNIQFSGNNVSYTISDCAALERAAMEAAVDDARSRAEILAGVLDVTIGNIIGASDSSYTPYGGTSCSSSYYGPMPLGDRGFAEGGTSGVVVYSQVSITYAIP